MAVNQAYLFLMFTISGICIGLVFDFFRILRKSFKTINLITYIEDILFWILTGGIIIFFMYNFTGGSLRLFMILGLIFGLILYMLLFSNVIIKTFVILITAIKKIFILIITPFKFVYNFIKVFMTKKCQKVINKLKNLKKVSTFFTIF